jgi:hypothetical protein
MAEVILNQETVTQLMISSYQRGYNMAKKELLTFITKSEPDMLEFSKFLMEFDKKVDEERSKK